MARENKVRERERLRVSQCEAERQETAVGLHHGAEILATCGYQRRRNFCGPRCTPTASAQRSVKGGSGSTHASIRGDLLVVLSMFAAIAWILISKRLMGRHSPLTVTAFVYWIGTLLLAVVVVTASGVPTLHYSTRAWIALAEQGFFATAGATVFWNWGLKLVPASQAGIFVNLEPLVGAILGVSFLHEALGMMALAGGALLVGGAVYFSYKPERVRP